MDFQIYIYSLLESSLFSLENQNIIGFAEILL